VLSEKERNLGKWSIGKTEVQGEGTFGPMPADGGEGGNERLRAERGLKGNEK